MPEAYVPEGNKRNELDAYGLESLADALALVIGTQDAAMPDRTG